MADSSNELTVPKPDAGMAFRMEMWATNALLGYWWVLVGIIVAVLLGVAVYGFIDSTTASAQRKASQQTEAVLLQVQDKLLDQEMIESLEKRQGPDGKMVRVVQIEVSPSYSGRAAPGISMLPLSLALERFPREGVEQGPVLTEAGDALMAIYNGNSGVAAHHAALNAAELYALAGDAESERKALDAAAGSSASPIRYAAQARIAMNAVDAGDAETLEAMLRPWIKEENGYFGQQAAYDLGRAYEALDRPGDAEAVYRELLNTWSVTPFRDMVDLRLTEMGVDTVPMEIELEQEGVEPAGEGTAPEGEGQGSDAGDGAGE